MLSVPKNLIKKPVHKIKEGCKEEKKTSEELPFPTIEEINQGLIWVMTVFLMCMLLLCISLKMLRQIIGFSTHKGLKKHKINSLDFF
jgi:hypothetical protein